MRELITKLVIVEPNRGKAGTGWEGTEADYQMIKDESRSAQRWIHPWCSFCHLPVPSAVSRSHPQHPLLSLPHGQHRQAKEQC